jgi:arylsulfatase A-like enzyme
MRKGHWKYIEPGKGLRVLKDTNTETGHSPDPQLYDLSKDPGEKNNVAADHPELVKELWFQLQTFRGAVPKRD